MLLHGLAASPRQFAAFGRLLFERGHNVLVLRLPRHGHADRLTDEMSALTAPELAAFGAEAARHSRTLGERTIVVGFSVGGLVASFIAQHEAIDRVVAIAPFFGLSWLPPPLSPHAARLALQLPNAFLWWNPLVRERLEPAHGYPRYATHAVAQAYRLSREIFAEAEAAPPRAGKIVLVVNAREHTVNNGAVERLAERWTRTRPGDVELYRLRGLPISHDIIEPARAALVRRVYPELLALVDR